MLEIRLDWGEARRWRRALLWGAALIGLAWVVYIGRSLLLPLFIALLIAMILDPLVDRMERRGWSRLKGAILIYAAFFAVTGTALTLALPAVISQTIAVTNSLGQYLPGDSESRTKQSLKHLLIKLHATPFVEQQVLRASAQISRSFGSASSLVGKMAEGMVSNLIWIVVIPIVAFYALKDFHVIYARLLLFIPRDHRSNAQQFINDVTAIFVRYLRSLLIVCALNAVVTALALMAFRLPNALALGAIAGVLYVVPYFGPVVTIAMIAGVSLMSGTIQMTLILVAAMIVLHSVIFDQIVTPRIVGQHVGLHPILSIIALLLGGELLGILGMILAVPVAATVQMVLLAQFPKLRQPIEVPTGEELHGKVDQIEKAHEADDEVENAVDVHQTIVDAVDTAEDQAQEDEPSVAANALEPSSTVALPRA